MEAFARTLYAVFGVLSLLAGGAVLAVPSLLSDPSDPPVVSHLLREEAAAFVFIGLMFLWARRHFSHRRPVHLAFLVFTGLFAVIHWTGYFRDFQDIWPSVVNTLPFVLLLIATPRGHHVRGTARASL